MSRPEERAAQQDHMEWMRQRAKDPQSYRHYLDADWDAMRWAVAEIERLRALVPQWRPFETAPHNHGKHILVWCSAHRSSYILFYDIEDGEWIHRGFSIAQAGIEPTHWQRLPAPPEEWK